MSRASVLMLPGWTNSGPEHWQSYWERAHPEYRRVEQANWDTPTPADWLPTIGIAIDQAAPPVVLVAQSLGCIASVTWASQANPASITRVAGAFLVAPADVERKDAGSVVRRWRPIPLARLPFPSVVVASRTDPCAAFARSEQFVAAWAALWSTSATLGTSIPPQATPPGQKLSVADCLHRADHVMVNSSPAVAKSENHRLTPSAPVAAAAASSASFRMFIDDLRQWRARQPSRRQTTLMARSAATLPRSGTTAEACRMVC